MRISEREDKLTRTSTMTLWLSHSSMNSGLLFLPFWKESSPLKATLKETSALRCYVCPSTACVAKLILTSKQQFPWLRPRVWRLTVPMILRPPFFRLACQILRVLLNKLTYKFQDYTKALECIAKVDKAFKRSSSSTLTTGPRPRSSRVVCFFCGSPGHVVFTCFRRRQQGFQGRLGFNPRFSSYSRPSASSSSQRSSQGQGPSSARTFPIYHCFLPSGFFVTGIFQFIGIKRLYCSYLFLILLFTPASPRHSRMTAWTGV